MRIKHITFFMAQLIDPSLQFTAANCANLLGYFTVILRVVALTGSLTGVGKCSITLFIS